LTTLSFTITFHGPFRVGAAYARDGIDAAIDHDDPLPADHLKGVMRDAAAAVLGSRHPVLGEVFGSPRTECPWAWSSAQVGDGDWHIGANYRVKIDPETHSAKNDHLVFGEQAWPRQAAFAVTGPASPGEEHLLILRCAAAGVHNLGAWRRRGLGWVGITPDDGPVTADEVAALLVMRNRV
jgi:hypothetical protein